MSEIVVNLADGMDGWLLGLVRVGITCIDVELAKLAAAKAGLGEHSPNGTLDKKHGTTLANDAWGLDFLTTHVARETGVNF